MVGKRKDNSAGKVLKESAKDWCENTSVHGFAYWVSSGKNYEGGSSISLSAVISMQPLGIEQANNPHMKAKDVPFHMGYGGLICSKALQNDRPK